MNPLIKEVGSLFGVLEDSDYVHNLLVKAIDDYASLQTKATQSNEEVIIKTMIDKCFLENTF